MTDPDLTAQDIADADALAGTIGEILKRLRAVETRQQLGASSVGAEEDEDAPTLGDIVAAVPGIVLDIEGMNETLDANREALRENAEAVRAGAEAAEAAAAAGVAAGELANEVADDALVQAGQARDNAADAIERAQSATDAAADAVRDAAAARQAAADATQAAGDAHDLADQARQDAAAADQRARDAAEAAAGAVADAGGAVQAAQEAKDAAAGARQDAAGAVEAAANAGTRANDAYEAATGAQETADGALSAATSNGRSIVQPTAPSGANADPKNTWIDTSTKADGTQRNTINRYGLNVVPDPATVALILPSSAAQAEREVMRVSVAKNTETPVALTLSASMNLNGVVKSSVARLRDGLSGAVLASYTFTDKGDSTGGDAETWTLPAGFTVTPTNTVLVVTIQSDIGNIEVYSLHRTMTANGWAPAADLAALEAAQAAQATANSRTRILAGPGAPTVDGITIGDLWLVIPDESTGIRTGEYRWTATGWKQQTVGSSVLASVDAGKITSGYIAAARIQSGTIVASMIAGDTITAAQIAANAITASELAAGAVIAGKIAANAITANEIVAGSIGTGELAAGAVTAAKITAGTITGDRLAVATITGDRIAAQTVTAAQLLVGDFTNLATIDETAGLNLSGSQGGTYGSDTKIENGYLTRLSKTGSFFMFTYERGPVPMQPGEQVQISLYAKTTDGTTPTVVPQLWLYPVDGSGASGASVSAAGVVLGATEQKITATVTLPEFDPRTIARFIVGMSGAQNSAIAVRAVRVNRRASSTLIGDGVISTEKIVAAAITGAKIAADTITAANIAAGAIQADEIAASAVTTDKIAANAITAAHISAGAIQTDDLAANAVTAAKIAAATITAAQIAAGTITTDLLAAGAVTAAKIAAATITGDKIVGSTITGDKIAANTITAADIAAATITGAEIAADTLTSREIAADSITAAELAANAVVARNIKAAEITGDKIAARTIAAGNIVAGTLTATEIATGTITADKIAAGAITAEKLTADAINGKTITGATLSGGTVTGGLFETTGNVETGTYLQAVNGVISLYDPRVPAAFTQITNGNAQQFIISNIGKSGPGHDFGIYGTRTGSGDLAPFQFTGSLNTPDSVGASTIRLTSTGDASLTGTGHAIQVGPSGGTNLIIDNNEVMVRNAGDSAGLYLNADGGTVGLGNNDSTINLPGILNASYLPSRIRMGTATHTGSIAAGAFGTDLRVTFPTGYFTSTPVVQVTSGNSRVNVAVSNVSSTGCTINLGNWSNGTANGPIVVQYEASQFSG